MVSAEMRSTPIAGGNLVKTIEHALLTFLPQCRPDNAGRLNEALRDAVFPGGKRIRPVLTVLGARIFGAHDERVMGAACGVEFVHTSSLIIDDLPCMDDADLRRGNPALHCVYGENVALLAGIALLNQAYALFRENPELIREATECIGVAGMIEGQAIDMGTGGGGASLAERDYKTSAMMRLAFTAGALAAGASRDEVVPLAAAGQLMGQAYQICDDLLDVSQASYATGKTADQDSRHHRPSHAAHLDKAACYARAAGMMEKARRSLVDAYGASDGVVGLLGFIDKIFASAVVSWRGDTGEP
jgi:geranylgeranyl diphosphate synthase type II